MLRQSGAELCVTKQALRFHRVKVNPAAYAAVVPYTHTRLNLSSIIKAIHASITMPVTMAKNPPHFRSEQSRANTERWGDAVLGGLTQTPEQL